jgi:hypothetical protein
VTKLSFAALPGLTQLARATSARQQSSGSLSLKSNKVKKELNIDTLTIRSNIFALHAQQGMHPSMPMSIKKTGCCTVLAS